MIVNLLAGFFFSYYFVNVAGFPNAIKAGFKMQRGARLKPFDCVTCLSVWTSAALFFLPHIYSEFLCIIFGAGFIGQKIK
jgi:hypothetical protein